MNIPPISAKAILEVIFTESKNKKLKAPKAPQNFALPPSEYDGENEESGVILSPSEAIDFVQGQDSL